MIITGRRRHLRPYKVYIFLISINSRVDKAMSVRLLIPVSALLSETIRAWATKFGTYTPLGLEQFNFFFKFLLRPLQLSIILGNNQKITDTKSTFLAFFLAFFTLKKISKPNSRNLDLLLSYTLWPKLV